MIKQYVKKPIPVEAVKVEKENYKDIIALLEKGVTEWSEKLNADGDVIGFVIHSWEGVEPTLYNSDYYIIKGIKGECYPCEGGVFRASYEEVNNNEFGR